jgi:hypothetical protein
MPQEVRIYTFKLPKEYWSIGDKLEELANLEKVSISEIIRNAIEEYVKKHKEGNPQKPLFPASKPWEIPIVERRRENLEWIESIVERNAGKMTQLDLMAQFSSISGLKMDTVKEYIHTLLLAKRLKVQGGKVYHKDNLRT